MNAFEQTHLLTELQKAEYVEMLEEALDLKETKDGGSTWNCNHDFANTEKILKHLSVEYTGTIMEFFRQNGGSCDCEIMINVVQGD